MDYIPPAAIPLLPAVVAQAGELLPQIPDKSWFAGQIEQESCISLKHPRCWSAKVELKTAREYGFGLGQLTTAYRPDGSVRFNAFEEVRLLDNKLRNWKWENRFDAQMQIRAIMVKNRQAYNSVTYSVKDVDNSVAMMFAAYNGGIGGLLNDRKLCQATKGCNPNVWWGNVERTSNKSRTKWHGYGKSPFEINREYPHLIMRVRSMKYKAPIEGLTISHK